MEDSRDVQTSERNGSSWPFISSGSAMAMEIKRRKTRQNKNTNIQEKLDFEMRMRDGAYKLLLASSKKEQVLNASKNLLTCNARIKAYLAQKKKEEQDMTGAVRGFVISAYVGLRIPLLWRDSHHFNDRGSKFVIVSVTFNFSFCVIQMGSEVFDTEMVVVDRSVTDICFEGVTIFKEAVPHFELKLTLVNTPKKLAKKLRSSFGKAAGKKLCHLLDTPDPDTFLQYNPIPSGAKYSLLAYTTLCLPEAEGSFQSHSFIVLQNAEWSSWLPLYGNLCCRLVAQPACMTQSLMTGYLSQRQSVEGMNCCCRLYCALSAGFLSCYYTPEEIDAKVQPTLSIPINKDTQICVMEKDSAGQKSKKLLIINPSPEGSQTVVFTTDTMEELEHWLDALHQHLYDQSQWLHCCNQLMEIEVTSQPKPSLFLTKQADSVYNDLSISSPGKFESITDIIHNKIEETDGCFLIGHEEQREAPNWSTLFDGSHSVVVQKSVLSQSKTSTPCSSPNPNTCPTSTSNKKRRAPLPPSDIEPYATPTHPEKENSSTHASRPATRSKTGRPSLDAKFSAIIQQLQPSHGSGPGPVPVPAPRSKLRKSFRERINLKAL
uniref:PH domain-containing protein n=1 Tax=Monopterus albus TaxID=43700 RepID=A0A3Q3IEE4_MONAL